MKRKTPAIVSVAILTVITIFMWIALSVYRTLTAQPPLTVSPEILEPISPILDRETLVMLAERTYFEEADVPETFVSEGPQVSQELVISPIPTEEATTSAELTPTP